MKTSKFTVWIIRFFGILFIYIIILMPVFYFFGDEIFIIIKYHSNVIGILIAFGLVYPCYVLSLIYDRWIKNKFSIM
jgi:hypothetical protein